MRVIKSIAVASMVFFLMVGCSTKAQKSEQAGEGEVLIRAGETRITLEDINMFVEGLPESQRNMLLSSDEQKKALLDRLTDTVVLAETARQEKMNETPEYAFRRKFTDNQIMAELYYRNKISKKMEEVEISGEEARKYYDENLASFSSGQVKASHILVKTMEEAEGLHKQLLGSPEKFEELASAHSTCPSAAKGGDLGWFGRGKMVPEFEQVAFSLETGAMSAPVQTRFGVHIIRVDEKTEITQKAFEEVEEQIKASLLGEKQQKWMQEFMEEQKEKLEVAVDEELLGKIGGGAEKPLAPPAPPETEPEK